MGKAFVAKLAKEGARDPEALAAWIGRKKHGPAAFTKLSTKGRKDSGSKGGQRSQSRAEPSGQSSGSEAARVAEQARAEGIASVVAHQQRQAEDARRQLAEQRVRQSETLARVNSAPGKLTRKAMTKEERALVNATANGATLYRDRYEALKPFADESAQTNRVDVLKSRAYAKAKTDRQKNGWADWDADPSAAPESKPETPRRRDPVAEARARNAERAAETRPPAAAQGPSGFTEGEERQLAATARQTAQLNRGQLEAYEQAYKPGTLSTGRTRTDDLRYEAVQRELKRREQVSKQIDSGLDRVRALNRGARSGSLDRRSEGVEPMRLRRMSDADVERNLQLVNALYQSAEDIDRRLDRKDKSLLYNVGSALRSERDRRNRPPLR